MRAVKRWMSVGALASALILVAGVAVGAPPFVEDDAEALYVLEGESVGDLFGWVAADIGDLDGDGVADIAVPAITDPTGGPAAGRVYVYSGATGDEMARHDGDAYELFGYSTAGAGDVNADGVPDYIAGAPGTGAAPEPPLGRAVVFSGADHSILHIVAPPERSFFGSAVSAAGDLNDDGHDDFLVGAMVDDGATGVVNAYSGADASILWSAHGVKAGDLFGSAAGLVGDVNDDDVPDVSVGAFGSNRQRGTAYVLSGADGSIIHILRPLRGSNTFGQFFASGAGDVDADGVNDVFVGDYNGGRNVALGTGAAYVFSGATGEMIHALTAENAGDGFGPGRGVGDVNEDGHADLIVAGYTSSAGAPAAGKAFVISGADGSVMRTITSTIAGENFGVDALGVGDVDGDGLTDYLITAVGLSFAGVEPGVAYVVKGTDLTN